MNIIKIGEFQRMWKEEAVVLVSDISDFLGILTYARNTSRSNLNQSPYQI